MRSRHSLAEALHALTRIASLAVAVGVPLVVSPWAEGADAYTLPKARATVVLAALALAGWAGLRRVEGRPRWIFTAPELPLWIFVLAALLSTATSVDVRLSLLGAPIRHEGLVTVAAYVALFFVGVHFFGSRPGMMSLATAAGATAGVVALYGLLQLIVPPLFAGEAFMRAWYGGLGAPRLVSTVGGPVVFGGYLATTIPLLLAVGAVRARTRLLWWAAAVPAVVALALTLTRAAWLAAVVGLAAAAGAGGRQALRRYSGLAAAVAVSAVLAVGGVALVASPRQVAGRVASSVDVSAGSVAQRLYIWRQTVHVIQQRPWLGWGLETLGKAFPYDRATMVPLFGPRPVIVDRAHNDLLQVAVSVGIPGALAYLTFWALVVRSAMRLARATPKADRALAAAWLGAVVAYLVQAQFSFSTVAFSPVVWLLAGAACGWEADKSVNAEARERGSAA